MTPSNPVASETALIALKKTKQAITESGNLLMEARRANEEFAVKQDSAALARRAMLSQKAYDARMSAEVGRVTAAYALLAASETDAMNRANAVMQQVTDAQRQRTLQREVRLRGLRVNAMVEAMKAAEQAFSAAPGLPAAMVGPPPSAQQVTVGMTQTFRSPSFIERASTFFPSDIRAAAGSFAGMGCQDSESWAAECDKCIRRDAENVRRLARELADKAASKSPDCAALSQRALAFADSLESETASEALPSTMSSGAQNLTLRATNILTSGVSIAGFTVPYWLLAGAGFYILSRR